jgi:hypothetical protein
VACKVAACIIPLYVHTLLQEQQSLQKVEQATPGSLYGSVYSVRHAAQRHSIQQLDVLVTFISMDIIQYELRHSDAANTVYGVMTSRRLRHSNILITRHVGKLAAACKRYSTARIVNRLTERTT